MFLPKWALLKVSVALKGTKKIEEIWRCISSKLSAAGFLHLTGILSQFLAQIFYKKRD